MTGCRDTESVTADEELLLRSQGTGVGTLPGGGKTYTQPFECPGRGRARGRS